MKRIDKIKNHLRNNKKTYIACSLTAATTYFFATIARQPQLVGIQQITNQPLSWKPTSHQTIDVHIEALGDPGNIIQDTTTGTIYASQGQAGRELGLDPGRISEQLAGKRETVNGHTFVKLGKAHVAQ